MDDLDRLNQTGPAISFRVFAAIQDEEQRFRRGYRKVTLSATLIGYPALAMLGFAADPLFLVLFGPQWVVAARAFQILCLAGAFKMLNAYSASVVEAAGHVWAEVWRQAIYLALILGGVVALQAWGTTGAAVAVLIATLVMTVLLHQLLLSKTPVTMTDVIVPQLPAAGCAAGVLTALAAVEYAFDLAARGPWLHLAALGLVGALVFLVFLVLAPVASVRELVSDVLEHLGPVVKNTIGLGKSAPAIGPSVRS